MVRMFKKQYRLWLFIVLSVLALSLIAEAYDEGKAHAFSNIFGFFAWLGFVVCTGLIGLAKMIGFFIHRPENYYDND